MELLDFFMESLLSPFYDAMQKTSQDLKLTRDSSDYVVVDGEEGDYGVIRFLDETGQVVGKHIIHGGDSSEYELTEYGRPIMMAKMHEAFKEAVLKETGVVL